MSNSDSYPQEYIDGEVEFFYQKFFVNEHVLIPRYETETLVRHCIRLCGENQICSVYDIGTGSGIIPLSIAKNTDGISIQGTDISEEALKVARKNTERLGLSVTFIQGDLLGPIVDRLSTIGEKILITANLPYVGTWEKEAMSEDTKFEPDVALFGDSPDGFDIYRKFFGQLQAVPQAMVVIEFGMWQRDIAEEEIKKYGWEYSFFEDERGIERFAQIRIGG